MIEVARVADAEQAALWARFRRRFIEESPPPGVEAPGPGLEDEIRDWVVARFRSDSFSGWLARLDGRPAGAGGLSIYEVPPSAGVPGREAYVMSMYTEPELRGRGVGRALVEAMVDHARALEPRIRVWLLTTEAGRALYDSLGFEPDPRYRVLPRTSRTR